MLFSLLWTSSERLVLVVLTMQEMDGKGTVVAVVDSEGEGVMKTQETGMRRQTMLGRLQKASVMVKRG